MTHGVCRALSKLQTLEKAGSCNEALMHVDGWHCFIAARIVDEEGILVLVSILQGQARQQSPETRKGMFETALSYAIKYNQGLSFEKRDIIGDAVI